MKSIKARLGRFSAIKAIYHLTKDVLGFFQYIFALVFQRPYFGRWLKANQCTLARIPVMDALIRKASAGKQTFNVLEIGAWAGVSTSIWARALKDGEGGQRICR